MKAEKPLGPIKAAGIVLLASALFLSALPFSLSSCTHREVFGEMVICSDIDSQTFEPVDLGDEYEINSSQIVAAVKVSGIKGGDRWRFTWRNSDTGKVIADSANIYSTNNSAFVEGYLSNRLLPAEGASIIAEPGNYSVSYYHNGELKAESGFIIKKPSPKIEEIGMYKGLDENGEPETESQVFYQGDEVYAAIKLDYKLSGEKYGIKWYQGDVLLGEEEYYIRENSYIPGYIIFQLINESQEAFPVESYKLEIIGSGRIVEEYIFEVIPEEYSDSIFAGDQAYINDEFGFEITHPDGWFIVEEEIEAGIKTGFTPDDRIKKIIIDMWVLKKDYSPEPADYSSFADKLLAEQEDQDQEGDIEKTESSGTAGDIELFEVRYDNIDKTGGGWSMTFSFFKKDGLLFLFMRLADPSYIDYSEKVVDYMIGSISFNE